MAETKHTPTPTPWAAFTDDSGRVPHTNIMAVKPVTACVLSLPGCDKRDPNVEFIIEAVNSHASQASRIEELEKARDAAKSLLGMMVADTEPPGLFVPDGIDANDFANAFDALETAIAKAEGR